ncbi:MAG: ABC transporter permease [Eubacterium sp.]|nr:ABC transporter permease [Eubacterium sp.]MDD7208608.1 ABC transporter permease [Lachnospiraceae bacterium]MDY5497389.1 ABC transporter permease [Anaerobutyricum sp.]
MNKKSERKLSAAQIQYLKKTRQHKNFVLFFQIFLLIFLIFLWEIAAKTGQINSFIFSSPSRMVLCAKDLFINGHLFTHIAITLSETFAGFFLVSAISLLTAILLWWNRTLCEITEPYFVILNSLPKSAMAPIFIVWLGNNMKTIIVTAVSVAIFGSVLNLFTSFLSTDPDKLKLIRTLGGSRGDCLTKVVLPINLPTILSVFKVDIGLCLIGVVIGEFLAARQGLGYLIIYGSQVFLCGFSFLENDTLIPDRLSGLPL